MAELAEQLARAQALAATLRDENRQLCARLERAQPADAAAGPSTVPGAPETEAAAAQQEPAREQGQQAAHAARASPAIAAAGALPAQAAAQAVMGCALPFDSLSQAMSQGSLEWMEGVIMPSGSSTQAELEALVAAAAAHHAATPAAPAQQPEQAQQLVPQAEGVPSAAGSSPGPMACLPRARPPFLEHAHGACPPRVFELPLSQPAAAEAAGAAPSHPAQSMVSAGGQRAFSHMEGLWLSTGVSSLLVGISGGLGESLLVLG